MKKFFLFSAIVAGVFMSCDQNETEPVVIENNQLKITTSWANASAEATRAIKSEFEIGDELGLYITSGTLDGMYNNKSEYSNVISIWGGSTWTQGTNVYLDNKEATIYAYYPYSSSAGNGKSIPVESSSQTDYLYGKGANTATISNPSSNIEMKHALSQLAFRIKTKNYSGNGILQSLTVSNNNGANVLYTRGTLNCQTGVITGIETGTLNLAASHYLTEVESVFSCMTLPIKDGIPDKGILLTFKIDDVNYTYELSAGTVWLAGVKNIYTITLEAEAIVIGGGGDGADGVTIAPWTETSFGEIKLTPM